MLDILRDLSRPIMDPFGLGASENPILSFIGDPIGLYPDTGGDGKGGILGKGGDDDDDDDKWGGSEQRGAHRDNQGNRIASGSVDFNSPSRSHSPYPYTKQIAQANELRGVY